MGNTRTIRQKVDTCNGCTFSQTCGGKMLEYQPIPGYCNCFRSEYAKGFYKSWYSMAVKRLEARGIMVGKETI
jgi:hypothetical protein